MKKIVSLVLVLCLLFSLGISASAASTEKVDITYRSIKLELNGSMFIPCDGSGKIVEPFIMNSTGTTYLPVRALAQALGLGVDWDAKTNTVILSSGGEVKAGEGVYIPTSGTKNVEITYRDIKVTLDGVTLRLTNSNGESVEPFIMDGTTYLPLRVIGEALGLNISWNSKTSTVSVAAPEASDPGAEDGYWLVSKLFYDTPHGYNSTTTYSYDARGNCVREATSANNGYSEEYKSTFNAYNERVSHSWTTSDGDYYKEEVNGMDFYCEEGDSDGARSIYAMRYDSKGNLIYNLNYYRDGDYRDGYTYRDEYTYEYDSQGRLVKVTCKYSNNDDSFNYTEVLSWSGNVCTVAHTENGITSYETVTYTYDSQGRVTKEAHSNDYGYGHTTSYKYDKYGNEVYREYADDDGYTHITRREYDAYGNILMESFEENGYLLQKYTYSYNADGLMTKSQCVSSDSSESYLNEFYYDANGLYLGEYREDCYGYTRTDYTYDGSGLLTRVERTSYVEGDVSEYTTTYNITNNENGLPVRADGVMDGQVVETYTCEYTFIKL